MWEVNNLFVRINYRAQGVQGINNTERYVAHIGNKKNKSSKKYLVCGGIYNKNGGTIIYKAKNMQEAKEIANNNILSKGYNRKYEEVKRDLVVLPENLI